MFRPSTNLDDFGAELAAVRQRLAAVRARDDDGGRVASLALSTSPRTARTPPRTPSLRARRPARFRAFFTLEPARR